MIENFVNTFKRDYVARMDPRDAKTALAQLSAAFEHFTAYITEVQEAAQVRHKPSTDQTLCCE